MLLSADALIVWSVQNGSEWPRRFQLEPEGRHRREPAGKGTFAAESPPSVARDD